MALDFGSGGNFTVSVAGPFGSVGNAGLLSQILLGKDSWKGAVSPFFQTVNMDNISVNSKVDLLPSPQQLEQFRSQELAFTTENDGGVVTVYAIGDKPSEDISFDVAIWEVVA